MCVCVCVCVFVCTGTPIKAFFFFFNVIHSQNVLKTVVIGGEVRFKFSLTI